VLPNSFSFVRINPHPFPLKKLRPGIWATSVIFIKLPKVNNRPNGQKLPNLVTLLTVSYRIPIFLNINKKWTLNFLFSSNGVL
jgi:hypothetical protein